MKQLLTKKIVRMADKEKHSIQKTLFDDSPITEYYGLNVIGDLIKIPNFQPLPDGSNPRLDLENEKGKRKNKKRK